MDRDSRERERGGVRSDVASLWIDFLLLPQKLEEHLAAGPAAVPSPADLISMFLEQALVSHKSTLMNSSANSAIKDTEPQAAVKPPSRTAALLCERAARVAVVKHQTLSDIESSISSQLHQFVLLKALIRHDKSRSLLHQCNLHRWLIHKALQSHPVGSASPNVVLPTNRLGSWVTGDDLGEVFHGFPVGNGDAPSLSNGGDTRVEEELASVEFLEKVLLEEELAVKHEDIGNSHTDTKLQKEMANGGSNGEQALSIAYKCQVTLDVAEVHFMRGRIRRANELFMRCGEMLALLSVGVAPSVADKREGSSATPVSNAGKITRLPRLSPVPQDRLAGFIIACKMLLGTSADGRALEKKWPPKRSDIPESYFMGATSPAQWAVIACERSRSVARGSHLTSQNNLTNGALGSSDLSRLENKVDERLSGRMSLDTVTREIEDNSVQRPVFRKSRKRTYLEEANGELTPTEQQLEKDEKTDRETVTQVKETESDDMELDKISPFNPTDHSVGHLSNGIKEVVQEERGFQEATGPRERKSVDVKDGKPSVQGLSDVPSRIGADILKKDSVTSVISDCNNSEVQLFVDLNGDPAGGSSAQISSEVNQAPCPKPEHGLIQAFVEDIFRGHLSWGYCLSVEKDPMLSKSVRSKLAACNAVRSVLEGAPVESFLRISDIFEDSKDAVEFLMQLLLAIKVMQAGNNLSTNKADHGADPTQNGRVWKFGVLKPKVAENSSIQGDVSVVSRRMQDLAMYACCVIDKPWCWASAVKHELVGRADLPRHSDGDPLDIQRAVDIPNVTPKTGAQLESMQNSSFSKAEMLTMDEILLRFVELENIHDIEVLVGKVHKMAGRGGVFDESPKEADESLRNLTQSKTCSQVAGTCDNCPSPAESDSVKPILRETRFASRSSSASVDFQPDENMTRQDVCKTSPDATKQGGTKYSVLDADVAAILRRRAFHSLEIVNDEYVARRLYELALTFMPNDCDSGMMLWFLDSTELEVQGNSSKTRELPKKVEEDALPSFGLLDFVFLQLIEKEQWGNLCELYQWAASLIEPLGRDGDQISKLEKASESATLQCPNWQLRQKRLRQTSSMARILVDLMPRCLSLQIQSGAERSHLNEEVARVGSALSQLFEDFLFVLVGGDSDPHVQGSNDSPQWRSNQGMGPSPHLGMSGVPLIARVSNPRVLMALASLTAGWLQRCHARKLTPWPLPVDRYGVLATVTAGATLPPPVGSLPYPRPAPLQVPPDFAKDLFGVLLEAVVGLPGFVEGDREQGHRWLQGLADLAFEEEAYVKALQFYLQAGAIRSAQYCDRAESMNRDVFTPWVIQRMVAACRAIGAGVQAAVLCQCLPIPDHESAFRILQENILIMDRDAASYFECLWEVPILELLVHLHSKAGDEERVNSLIGLLQQPALNVHNPPAIRQAHISTMEQRFLKRLAGELL